MNQTRRKFIKIGTLATTNLALLSVNGTAALLNDNFLSSISAVDGSQNLLLLVVVQQFGKRRGN